MEAGTFRVLARRTERHLDKQWRTVPIPTQAVRYVTPAWEAALVGQMLVFPNHQITGAAITGKVKRLCRKAGVVAWPQGAPGVRQLVGKLRA